MSEFNWIDTTIEVTYRDGSKRQINIKPGESLWQFAAGEDWVSIVIVESPYGTYSHDDITPKDEAGSREGALDPG